jgi:DNA-binding SARP family transcriptional activator
MSIPDAWPRGVDQILRTRSGGGALVRYKILGPLRLVHDDGQLYISARKIEILLAALLIRSEKVVTVHELFTEIWGQQLPRRSTAALYVYVSQLRKLLSRLGGSHSAIVTKSPGYLLHLNGDELDLHVFQRRVQQARAYAAAERHGDAVAAFEGALDLWEGPALGDLRDGPVISGFATWLEEARLECTEAMIESYLASGRHRQVVGRLYDLTAAQPLREAFYRQLMIALYRSERQADALKVYHTARSWLNDELGLEPGRALRNLQRAMLSGDSDLDVQPYPMTS